MKEFVHYDKGMECIDCHTSNGLHGDGNIYNKKEKAVEIECVDCHGTTENISSLQSSRGNKLNNLSMKDGKVVLTTKITNKELVVPQVKDIVTSGSALAQTAMGISGLARNSIQPHTVTRETRSCEDCHANPKAVGLGSGIYNARNNGLDIDFGLDRIVDEEGKQLQATSHVGARPFNKEEQ